MAEYYEDIIHNGKVVGRRLVSDAPVIEQPVTTMTKLTFMRRFSAQELIALREAAKTDPILDDAQRLLDWAQEVDVADPDTQRLVGYLAQIGIIEPEDVVRILAPLGV